MILKRAFRTGHCLVVAIPKAYAEALKIVPGTSLVLTLKDRALHYSRAVVSPESMHAPGTVDDAIPGATKGTP